VPSIRVVAPATLAVGLLLAACGGATSRQPAPTYSLSGAVIGTGNSVEITLAGPKNASAETTWAGFYQFDGLAAGNYLLTPNLAGYTFSPPSIVVTVARSSVTGIDFNATPVQTAFTVSGTVTGTAVAGVTVTLSGAADATATTNGTGAFSFGGLANGSYTVTPALSGYSFSPGSAPVTVNGANIGTLHFASTQVPASCSADGWCLEAPLPQANDLHAVWGATAGDVWAVGAAGATLHWNGSAWVLRPSGTSAALRGIWGSSSDNVWAVGDGGTILRWNGAGWTVVPSGTAVQLNAVWGSAANDVWTVGAGGTVLHWAGSGWSGVASGTSNDLNSIWGSSASDVYVVGSNLLVGPDVVHWNGSAWSNSSMYLTYQSPYPLYGVWGTGTHVLGVGSTGSGAATLSWAGSFWVDVASGVPLPLRCVWGASWTSWWMVGDGGTIVGSGGWTPLASGTASALYGIWGSAATDVWAVGQGGVMVHFHP
jgi:hypothetical protein